MDVMLKFTIITPVYQGEETIKTCIESVLRQSYSDFEYIIMDALSTDATVPIIKAYPDQRIRLISEEDKGLYDAFNKAIKIATGDILCFLCADDMYAEADALRKVAAIFQAQPNLDIVYSDIVYVNRQDTNKVERFWKSSSFVPGLYQKGWLPPNTSFYVKRSSLQHIEPFNIDFKYAADYEFNYRLLEKLRLTSVYLPEILVKMRSGGMSNSDIGGMIKSLKECYRVLVYHHVKFPFIYVWNTLFYRARQLSIPQKVKDQIRENVL